MTVTYTASEMTDALKSAKYVITEEYDAKRGKFKKVKNLLEEDNIDEIISWGTGWGDIEIQLQDDSIVRMVWDREPDDHEGSYVATFLTKLQKFLLEIELDYSFDPKFGKLRELYTYTAETLDKYLSEADSIGYKDSENPNDEVIYEEGYHAIHDGFWNETFNESVELHNEIFINLPTGDTVKVYRHNNGKLRDGSEIALIFEVGTQFFKLPGTHSSWDAPYWEELIEVRKKIEIVQKVTFKNL